MRITEKDLEVMVARVNDLTQSPVSSYEEMPDGSYKAQVGNYHIDHAYGGVALHQMNNESGGVRDIFSCGHTTKRELYGMLQAFLVGISTGKSLHG